jgi:murein DD-endopeptidase MepM/ murein hydrolase activator NlpD
LGKKALSIIIATIIFILALQPVMASDLSKARNELEQVQKEMEQTKRTLQRIESERRGVTDQLAKIERDLDITKRELDRIQKQLIKTLEEVEVTKKELSDAENKTNKQYDTLQVRIRNLFMNGPTSYLEILFSATSLFELVTRFDLVKTILNYDITLLEQMEENRDYIAQKKAELEQKKSEIEIAQNQVNAKKRTIEANIASRERLLTQLEKDKKTYESALNRLEEDSKKIEKLIKELLAKEMAGYKGSAVMKWPVPSSTRVTSDYGWRVHPVLRTRRFHTGIDVGAQSGRAITAATHGTVIYTGWLGSYGQSVIISHGGGIQTLYAHMSSISVKEGQEIREGKTIGAVGMTGLATGPHLHFEVRRNGSHIDPWDWLKR